MSRVRRCEDHRFISVGAIPPTEDGSGMFVRFRFVIALAFLLVIACAPDPPIASSTSAILVISTNVLYADRWIDIGDNATVSEGDVAVRQVQAVGMREPNVAGAQIRIGSNASVGSSPASGPVQTLAGANITVGSGSWAGYVDTTTLTNNGAASIGPQSTFPTNLEPLPLSGNAGSVPMGAPLNVNTPTTLTPGTYGPLMVTGTAVQLKPGTYNFSNVMLQNALLTTTSATDTVTIYTNNFTSDPTSTIQPFPNGTAKRITILTAGPNQFDGVTRALVLSHDDLEISNSFLGAAAASTIAIGPGAHVTFEDGLNFGASWGSQQLSGYYANQNTFCVLGEPPPSLTLTLAFALPFADPVALAAFVDDRSDPTSPNYRQWLTNVAAFASSPFAPTDAAYTALESWASGQGLAIVETFPTKMLLTLSGTVAQFEAALFTRFHYRDNGTAQGFLAPDREPSLDLATPLLWIGGLDEWYPPHSADCGKTQPAQGDNNGTLVGGTPTYDDPYYNVEGVWTTGCAGFDTSTTPPSFPHTMTGGGILDGGCNCFPATSCCTTGTPIPTFQQNVPMVGINWGTLTTNTDSFEVVDPIQSGNGGSSSWRNFPDVAAAGDNVGIFADGQGINGGTSSATPLWAGFTALVNQLGALRGVNTLGYPNPTLYDIGKDTPINSVFHDVADGVFNQEPIPNTLGPGATNLGHPAVHGYDLATGWGSFSCPLLQALSNTVRSNVWIHVENGIDGVNDSSAVTLTINTSIVSIPPITIKAANGTGWSDGGLVHDIGPIAVGVLRPQDVTSVVLHIDEGGGGGDNWDVGGIQVYLTGAHNVPMACLVDLSGNDPDADTGCTSTQSGSAYQPSCQPLSAQLGNTNDTGVLRLSQDPPGDSGQGQTATFSTTLGNTGCPTWSDTAPAAPYDFYEIEIDTGDDGMETASSAQLTVFGNTNTDDAIVTLSSGTIFSIDSRVETWRTATPATPVGATDVNDGSGNGFRIDFSPSAGDEWHIQAVSVIGRSSSGAGPDTCILRWVANEAPGFEAPIVMDGSTPHLFSLADSSCP